MDRAVPVVQAVRGRYVEAVIMTPIEAKRLRSPMLAEGLNVLAARPDSMLVSSERDRCFRVHRGGLSMDEQRDHMARASPGRRHG